MMRLHTRKNIVLYAIEKQTVPFGKPAHCGVHPTMGQQSMKGQLGRPSVTSSLVQRKAQPARCRAVRRNTLNDSQETRRGAPSVPATFSGGQDGPLYN
jgi:hypothetical protein